MHKKLAEFLNKQNLFSNNQFGFRNKLFSNDAFYFSTKFIYGK